MRPRAQLQRQLARNVNLGTVTLAVIEGDAVDFIIVMQSLYQTGGGVLASAKDDNGTFHRFS